MIDSSSPNVRDLDRINLRLSAETFVAIDRARSARPGHVSRNTWVTEAVQEKLQREAPNQPHTEEQRHA